MWKIWKICKQLKRKEWKKKNECSKEKKYNEELKQNLKDKVDQASNMQSLNEEHQK